MKNIRKTSYNTGLAKVAVQCLNQALCPARAGLRNRRFRQAPNRYGAF